MRILRIEFCFSKKKNQHTAENKRVLDIVLWPFNEWQKIAQIKREHIYTPRVERKLKRCRIELDGMKYFFLLSQFSLTHNVCRVQRRLHNAEILSRTA